MNAWFESVAVAQARARKRLPKSVYSALPPGSEPGPDHREPRRRLRRTGLRLTHRRPETTHELATAVMGQHVSVPVIISPTGVQAVYPDGEVARAAVARAAVARAAVARAAVARAAVARGTAMDHSSFASKPVEDVVTANPEHVLPAPRVRQ